MQLCNSLDNIQHTCMMLWLVTLCLVASTLGASVDRTAREIFPGVGEYFFVRTPGNWTEAYWECQLGDASLATVESDAEAQIMLDYMAQFQVSFIHSGFHDEFIDGEYITLKGVSVEDPCGGPGRWAPGYPSGVSADSCGGFTADGIQNADCARLNMYACEFDASNDVLWPTYDHIPDVGYYRYESVTATWTDAVKACRSEGAHLLVLDSQQEADAVDAKYFTGATFNSWVGAHRYFGGNDNFVTIFGDKLQNGYATWYGTTQPSGTYLTAPYVYYSHTSVSQGLITFSNALRNYVCEKSL